MNCRYHPDREAVAVCIKYEYGYCPECFQTPPSCTDPHLYCRHRTACVIWEVYRENSLSIRKAGIST